MSRATDLATKVCAYCPAADNEEIWHFGPQELEAFFDAIQSEAQKQVAIEKERADYAWRNTKTIEKARQQEMARRDALLAATILAEDFIAGFEDDEAQEGIDEKLAIIRAAIAGARP